MRSCAGLFLILALAPQEDLLAAAKKDLGGAFSCQLLDANVLLASDTAGEALERQKKVLGGLVAAIKEHAVGASPRRPIRIYVFATEQAYTSFARERYGRAVIPGGYCDSSKRLLLVRANALLAHVPRILAAFWTHDDLQSKYVPDWIVSGLSGFSVSVAAAPAVDLGAARLQRELAQGSLPALRPFLALTAHDFRKAERFAVHEDLAARFFLYMHQRRALGKFFVHLRQTFDQDPSGTVAVAKALDLGIEEADRSFRESLKALRWANEERLREEARLELGEGAVAQALEEPALAAASNAGASNLAQCVENVRRLRGPLRARFEMKSPNLPVQGVLFKDTESFRAYVEERYPGKSANAGYYDRVARRIMADLGCGISVFTHEYGHSLFEDDVGVLAPWVNEGLACLFENYRLEEGAVIGEGDGRLGLVRRAVQAGRETARVSRLVAAADADFYGPQRTFNYALASALFLCLQEKGTLRRFYDEVRSSRGPDPPADPASVKALEKACGRPLEKVDEEFRAWILGRKDP